MSTTEAGPRTSVAKLSLPALTAMVVGSMVGAGVFQLPARFAAQTGVFGALIAWAIAGTGMLTLAFVFQNLAVRKPQVFADNLTGGYDVAGGESLFAQVRGTMLVTVFVFLGIEGASVCSRYARRRTDVGKATVLGFVSVLALFASISILAYGILPRAQIAALNQPSVGGVLDAAVGTWGGTLIRVGLIVSVLGAYLAWQLLAADVVYAAAQDDDLPAYFARLNRHGAPHKAVLWTSVFVTVILFAVQFVHNALDFTLDLTAALALTPFALASGYAVKLAVRRDGYDGVEPRVRTRELAVAVLSSAYTLFLLWAAGYAFWFLACILLAPATLLYVVARRERRAAVFTRPALVTFAAIVVAAVVGAFLLATGAVQI